MVQWLGLCASTAGGTGSVPGGGTKIPHASRQSQEVKNKPVKLKNTPKNHVSKIILYVFVLGYLFFFNIYDLAMSIYVNQPHAFHSCMLFHCNNN